MAGKGWPGSAGGHRLFFYREPARRAEQAGASKLASIASRITSSSSSSESETRRSFRMAEINASSSPTPKSPSSDAWTASAGASSLNLRNRTLSCGSMLLKPKRRANTSRIATQVKSKLQAEVAHIFHNCTREALGLPHTLFKEWLLDIAYAKRETFAYACETYGRIVEQAQGTAGRRLLAQYARSPKPSDETVDSEELIDILTEAVEARNGWKRILARCSSSNPPVPRWASTRPSWPA